VTRSEKHFEEFAEHTRLKHLILDKYLNAWARKLLLGTPARQVWFVDAFAGAGRDRRGNDGSPVIAARIAAAVNHEMATRFGREGRMSVLAIERDPTRFSLLRDCLEPFRESRIAFAYNGSLDRVIDEFRRKVGDAPVLFFLDPFGLRGLAAELLPKLFDGPYNEVFLLFSGMAATRLHAVLDARRRDLATELQRKLPAPFLFTEINQDAEREVRAAVEKHTRALDVTQPAAAAILLEVFGQERLELLRATLPEQREGVYLSLFTDLLAEAGARYVLPFPVRNEGNREVYHLVYATQSSKGFATMKTVMSTAVNQVDLPHDVTGMITVQLRVDVARVADEIARRFAGRVVAWTDADERPTSAWWYAMEETMIFPRQKDELLQELKRRFDAVSSRPLMFRFP
jgi:three-Cys-motif partner protein